MARLKSLLSRSIGKKQIVALTGLALCGFLVSHLAGNLIMLKSPEEFDAYADFLEAHPLLVPAEIVLAILFVAHILWGLRVSWENLRARPERYAHHEKREGGFWRAKVMRYTGLLTLIFLFVHVSTFKLQYDENGMFNWIMSWFRLPLYAGFYVAAMLFLGLHINHGFQSAFQTFGLNHPKYTPAIKAVGRLFAATMAVGFGLLPVWAYFFRGGY